MVVGVCRKGKAQFTQPYRLSHWKINECFLSADVQAGTLISKQSVICRTHHLYPLKRLENS